MKTLLTTTLLALGLTFTAAAEDKHDHDHAEKQAGPNGGRLITAVEPHAEFLVTKERKVEIRFVDDDHKVVTPAEQVVTVTLGDRRKPTKLTFKKDGDKLVSDAAIPEGNNHPTVVQLRAKAGAKVVTERFTLNLSDCPTCDHAEYACTCDHGHDHDHDHDKKDEKKK